MALFTVQPATFGLFGGVEVMALDEALERDHQTVRRMGIPVHGAARNFSPSLTQPTVSVGASRTKHTQHLSLIHI